MAKEVSLTEFKNTRYLSLKRLISEEMARFCLCAVFNIAFDPDVDCVSFEDYVDQMKGMKFRDGIMDIGKENVVTDEQMETWYRTWGIGDPNKPYTVEDYKQLDGIFDIYSSRLAKSGGMDEQQEDTLKSCSKKRLESDKYIAKGGKENIDMAAKLDKMIQDQLASEQLRKRDEKPISTARFDGITDIMAKKHGLEPEMGYEEVREMIAEWMVSHKYPFTMDAAEHCYLAMINNARMNDDLPDIPDLPPELQIPRELSEEFAEKPNQEEKEAYEYLKIKNFRRPEI